MKASDSKANNIFPVVVHYSFDCEVPVYLFDNEDDACKEIRRQFEEEIRIEKEENKLTPVSDFVTNHSDDYSWAMIKVYGNDEDAVTEWTLGNLKKGA